MGLFGAMRKETHDSHSAAPRKHSSDMRGRIGKIKFFDFDIKTNSCFV